MKYNLCKTTIAKIVAKLRRQILGKRKTIPVNKVKTKENFKSE